MRALLLFKKSPLLNNMLTISTTDQLFFIKKDPNMNQYGNRTFKLNVSLKNSILIDSKMKFNFKFVFV
jgi:hypothetical protein